MNSAGSAWCSTRSSSRNGRVLIYRFGHIGDTIASLPSLWALRSHFAKASMALLCSASSPDDHCSPAQVLPRDSLVQGYLRYRGGASWRNLVSLGRTALSLRRQHYRVLAYLVPGVRCARDRFRDRLFFRLAGIAEFLGMGGFPMEPLPRTPDGVPARVVNEADSLLMRLAADGISVPQPGTGRMDLQITAEERGRARQWWERQPKPNWYGKRRVALGIGAKWESKRWPAERYMEVGRRLWVEQGLWPIIVGGEKDRELGMRLVANWRAGHCAAGELTVRESAALMADCLFYVGNDTGPMHLAAAMGRPCVAVFSAQDWPGRWDPYGPGHRVLRSNPSCAGCRLPVCKRQLRCLLDVDVERVYRACLEIMGQGS